MNICDACHASRSTHVARKDTHELYFCGHHYNQHEAALLIWADSVESLDKQAAMVQSVDIHKGKER